MTSADLRSKGIRSPQGFTFEFSKNGTFFWTSNEIVAYLFFKRYEWATEEVANDFRERRKHEDYLFNLSFATSSKAVFRQPKNYQYRPHQVAGIEYALAAKHVLIADEQRLGKTAIAIGVINNSPDIKRVLVLCPKTAKLGWVDELNRWLILPQRIQVLSAQTPIDFNATIYIVNYDILHIQTDLLEIDFDLIIADEVHFVCRSDARRTKFFSALNGKKKLGLSGTPLLNTPKDLLTIAQWLDPFWHSFGCKQDKLWSSNGLSLTLNEAQELMRSSILLRRIQAQVFNCEPVEQRVVAIEPTKAISELLVRELRQLEDYAKVRRILGLHKVPYVLNYIDTYTSNGEKIVVFAHHREVIDRLSASLGRKAVVLYGATSDEARAQARERFNTDPYCQVFIGSIAAASMAINLSVASHIVFAECDWSNGLMEQAKERCSDLLQDKPILIEYLAFHNSLDYYILNKVDYKNRIADKGLDKQV